MSLSPMPQTRSSATLGKLLAVGLILFLLAGALSVLMPSLQRARKLAIDSSLQRWESEEYDEIRESPAGAAANRTAPPAAAIVQSYEADIELTPKLSVGTAVPESIYDVRFHATVRAKAAADGKQNSEIAFPLPPEIVSLADLQITVNGDPSDRFAIEATRLVWRGQLDDVDPAAIDVTYTATGRGAYTLDRPTGRIIEKFRCRLVANQSDIRMLELSLQPVRLEHETGKTIYLWEYDRLVVARPIALDVLGISAIDRLGELVWLGPVSVFVFGVLVTMIALAYQPEKLGVWMLILIAGCFTAAYPLMYYLQELVSLRAAIAISAIVVLIVIAARAFTLFRRRVATLLGLVVPAGVMGLTLGAAIYATPAVQGVLLTIEGIAVLLLTMLLLPRVQANLKPPALPLPTRNHRTKDASEITFPNVDDNTDNDADKTTDENAP